MPTLLIRLKAPMQSWGTTSHFDERESQLEPSKSGVIGLICAALGRDRAESIDDLSSLRMGVRVDSEGVLMRDFQTVQGFFRASSKVEYNAAVVSSRYYLADASFLVGFEGEDETLLRQIQTALKSPVWPLYLGRKSFPPAEPLFVIDGIRSDESLEDALRNYPTGDVDSFTINNSMLFSGRLLIERRDNDFENVGKISLRFDQPCGPFSERKFRSRLVETVNMMGDSNVSI